MSQRYEAIEVLRLAESSVPSPASPSVSLGRRALQGALWNVLENTSAQLTSFVVFLVFTRFVSPGAVGVVQIAVTLLGFLSLFSEHGLTARIVRTQTSTPVMLSTAFWLGLSVACALAMALTFGSERVAAWYQIPELAAVLQALAWTVPVFTLSGIQSALLLRDLAFRAQARRRLLAVVGGGVVGIALALTGCGVWSIIARIAVETTLDCVIAWSRSSWRPSFVVSRDEAKEFASFGSRVVGSSAVGFLSRRADELWIGFVLGSTALGYFAVAARAMTLVGDVALRAAQRTAVPVLSRLQHDPDRLRYAYATAMEFGATVACAVFLGLSAIAPELCITLYGPQWQPVVAAMQIMGFAGPPLALAMYSGPLLIAVGRPDLLLRFSLAEMLFSLVTSAIAVHYGIAAVAAAYVARSYMIVPLLLSITSRILGATRLELLRPLAAPSLASLLMFTATLYLRHALALPPRLMLVTLVAAGALVYFAGLWLFGRNTLRRLHALAMSLRGTGPVFAEQAAGAGEDRPPQ